MQSKTADFVDFQEAYCKLKEEITGVNNNPSDDVELGLDLLFSSSEMESASLPSNTPLLVLRIDFNDASYYYSDQDWASRIFNSSMGVSAYYTEVSNNRFTFTSAAENFGTTNDGIVRVNLNENYPNSGSCIDDTGYREAAKAIRRALAAADAYIDFSSYDTDNNGTVSSQELAIHVLFPGYMGNVSGNPTPKLWGHRWSLAASGAGTITLDGVSLNNYAASADRLNTQSKGSLSTICHELGHILGLPDLYNTSGTTTTLNVSRMSLMSSSWGVRQSDQTNPSPQHLDPWSKIKLPNNCAPSELGTTYFQAPSESCITGLSYLSVV